MMMLSFASSWRTHDKKINFLSSLFRFVCLCYPTLKIKLIPCSLFRRYAEQKGESSLESLRNRKLEYNGINSKFIAVVDDVLLVASGSWFHSKQACDWRHEI